MRQLLADMRTMSPEKLRDCWEGSRWWRWRWRKARADRKNFCGQGAPHGLKIFETICAAYRAGSQKIFESRISAVPGVVAPRHRDRFCTSGAAACRGNMHCTAMPVAGWTPARANGP